MLILMIVMVIRDNDLTLTMLLTSISASCSARDCFVSELVLERITLKLKVHLCLCLQIIYFISGCILKWLEFPENVYTSGVKSCHSLFV